MYIFNQNIGDIFNKVFEQKNNKAFIVFGSQTVTYGELKSKIGKYTSYFNKIVIKNGDRVVFSSKDEIFLCYFYLSLIANGITAVLIDPESSAERANSLIKYCQPNFIFIDEHLIKKWNLTSESTNKIVPIVPKGKKKILDRILRKNEQRTDSFLNLIEELPESIITVNFNPESDAYILFTSGTISEPKGVRISYRALFSHLQTLKKVYQLTSDSRILNNLTLSHADGMIQGPILTFFSNSTLYRPFAFSIQRIDDIFDIIYREHISHWVMVPTMTALIYQLKQADSDTLDNGYFKYVISCASKLEAKLWRDFEQKFKTQIINGYGLTETVAGGLFAGPDKTSHVIGSIGIPVDCYAKIADEEGNELGLEEKGELWLRGSLLMSGYLNAPNATQEVFYEDWLKTGDIGYKGKDGCFRIVGREKTVIISGGMNVSPEEVTEVINTHPSIQEAITFGMPDEIWGEIVVCAIVLKQSETVKKEDIVEYCRQYLEEHKVPSKVHIMKELPRGPSGKVMLQAIREQVVSFNQEKNIDSGLKPTFLQIVSRSFQISENKISMHMAAEDIPAWDSLSHWVLISELEKNYKISFTPTEVMNLKTLSDIYTTIEKKLKDE